MTRLALGCNATDNSSQQGVAPGGESFKITVSLFGAPQSPRLDFRFVAEERLIKLFPMPSAVPADEGTECRFIQSAQAQLFEHRLAEFQRSCAIAIAQVVYGQMESHRDQYCDP